MSNRVGSFVWAASFCVAVTLGIVSIVRNAGPITAGDGKTRANPCIVSTSPTGKVDVLCAPGAFCQNDSTARQVRVRCYYQ